MGCPLLTERVGGLSPNEENMGEETRSYYLLRNQTMAGQKGSDCTSPLEEDRGGKAEQLGKHRTRALFVGVMLLVVVTFLHFRICLRADPHVFPCFT